VITVAGMTVERSAQIENKIAEAGSSHTGKPRAPRATAADKSETTLPSHPAARPGGFSKRFLQEKEQQNGVASLLLIALCAGDIPCRRNGMRNEERYPANLSVAATKARLFGGSVALWPPSAVMMSSASGHARCNAQALSIGQTTS
jgi:hypothetical protein